MAEPITQVCRSRGGRPRLDITDEERHRRINASKKKWNDNNKELRAKYREENRGKYNEYARDYWRNVTMPKIREQRLMKASC